MFEDKDLIVKKTLYAGTSPILFKDGTKIHFHFQTKICDKNNTLLDDSRKMGKGEPLHIILGKKFKLEVWEAILKKMTVNEVARFTIDKSLVMQYPFVSKTLRDMHKPKEERKPKHTCALTLQSEGIGYDDLNNYLKNPQDLEFTMGRQKYITSFSVGLVANKLLPFTPSSNKNVYIFTFTTKISVYIYPRC